jgi:hypothetical protein
VQGGMNPQIVHTIHQGAQRQRVCSGTAAPTVGDWQRGDIVYMTLPSASSFAGWICTASGAPGTWKTFGAISA